MQSLNLQNYHSQIIIPFYSHQIALIRDGDALSEASINFGLRRTSMIAEMT
jgi:hypothetical protein